MNENIVLIAKPFAQGLLPRLQPGIGSKDFLLQCKGMQPSDRGLIPIEWPAVTPVTSWPYPQLLYGREHSIVASGTGLVIDGEAASIYDVDGNDFSVTDSSDVWHFADAGRSWLITNGICVIYKRGQDDYIRGTNYAVNSVCYSKRRYYMGGFTSWQTEVLSFLRRNASRAYTRYSTDPTIQDNSVFWTSLSGEELFWLLTGEQGDFIEKASQNLMGFEDMPWQGEVKVLLPAGDVVYAFNENGVAALVPDWGNARFPGVIGVSPMAPIGCLSRHSVAGGGGAVLWLDPQYRLWVISGQEVKMLDYQSYMTLLNDPVISYDAQYQAFYISDEDRCFRFKNGAMCETDRKVCSAGNQGQLTTLVVKGSADSTFLFEVEIPDLATQSRVKINFVEMDSQRVSAVMMKGGYYTNSIDPTRGWTGEIPLDGHGCGFLGLNGFMPCLYYSGDIDTIDAAIRSLAVHIRYADFRRMTGYVDKAASSAS